MWKSEKKNCFNQLNQLFKDNDYMFIFRIIYLTHWRPLWTKVSELNNFGEKKVNTMYRTTSCKTVLTLYKTLLNGL